MNDNPSAFTDLLAFGKLRIRVMSGPSAGSVAMLPQNACIVGSGLQDDLVLLAYDLFEGHAQLSADFTPFAPLRVKALAGSVTVSGAQEIDPGQYLDVPTPAQISLGGCDLLIERPATTGTYIRWVAAIAALMLTVVALSAVLPTSLPTSAVGSTPTELPAAAAETGDQTAREAAKPSLDNAVQAKLAELGLTAQIVVKPANDGSIAFSGHFSGRTADAWREFLRWYDSQPAFPPMLNSVTRADESDDLPKIASIWAQEPAQVVMEDGRVVRVGEQLDVNWKFDGLTDTGIEISRNGTKVLIDF